MPKKKAAKKLGPKTKVQGRKGVTKFKKGGKGGGGLGGDNTTKSDR